MDIVLDCGDLFFGRNVALELEKNLNSLYDAMNGITISNELPSASLFSSVKSSLKNVIGDDIDDLITRLDNIIRILRENDQEAAYLFNYYEEGIINGDFGFTEMPLMDQTDYNNISYSQGTISTSGCGLTSICMVASYLTGDLYTPAELVGATRGKGDNVSRMLAAADSVGLVWHNDKDTSREDLKNYLRDGNIAVVLVRNSSHFVVCTGITEDGKVLVNDPYGPRATEQALSLDQLQFSAGNTWIFNPEENKGVKKELNDKIAANQTLSQLIMNEEGYYGRTSEPEIVTLPSTGNYNTGNNSNQTVILSNNPNGNSSVGSSNIGSSSTPSNLNVGTSSSMGNSNQSYEPVIQPQESVPQESQTSAPVIQPESVPQTPQTSAPVIPQEPAPQVPQTSAPVIPQEPAPQVPQTSAPVVPQEPAPQVPQTSAPVIPQEPTPQVPQTSAPIIPQEPAPQVPQTSAPVINQPSQNYNNDNFVSTNTNGNYSTNSSNNSTSSVVDTYDDGYRTSVGDGGSSNDDYTFVSPFDDVEEETTTENYSSTLNNNDNTINDNYYSSQSSNVVDIPNVEENDNKSSKFVAPIIAGVASVAAAGGAYAILKKKEDEKSEKKEGSSDKEGILSKLGLDK